MEIQHKIFANTIGLKYKSQEILLHIFTLNGNSTNRVITIPEVSYLLQTVPVLLEINENRGLELDKLVAIDWYEGEYDYTPRHIVNVNRDEKGITGLPEDRSSICFDYGYLDTNFVDRMEYKTAGLEENLRKPLTEIVSLYPIKKKDHMIGGGVFA